MRTINYRNGVVEFRIPTTWKEEYSNTDGGVFYEDKPDSGTLRLNVITVASQNEINNGSALDVLNALRQVQGRAQLLPNGNGWATFVESSIDREQKIKTFYWFISNLVPPRHARIATFSYTIPQLHEQAPRVILELKTLDQEIRAAEFSTELNITA